MNIKKVGILLFFLVFAAVAFFAYRPIPDEGLYKCTDENFRVVYIRLSKNAFSDGYRVSFLDSNQIIIRSVNAEIGRTDKDLIYTIGSNRNQIRNIDGTTILDTGSGKNYSYVSK